MLALYNTLTKGKQAFEPLHSGKAGIYTCGPTVYGRIHIGNLRAYLMADLLRRVLEHGGYEVRHIKNITDVGHLTADDLAQGDSGEDKVARQAATEKKTPAEIAAFYETYFHEAERRMNILPAHYFPRATAHIPQMIRMIEALVTSGHAYEKSGNVFLDVTSFPDYGKLSGNTLANLKVGARLEEHPDKRHPWDFALWLKAPEGHLMRWPSPWSEGYPGWHIECSAMSTEYLGDSFDLHTGGEDNIFPHHEAEIVQSEGVTGKPFVRYWMHTRHLLVDGVKMSKSKGNLYVLEDVVGRDYSPMDLRFLFLLSHYRSQMNFTWATLDQARANWTALKNFRERLTEYAGSGSESLNPSGFLEKFTAALDDDLNTPEAVTLLLDLANRGNALMDREALAGRDDVLAALDEAASLLGLLWEEKKELPPAVLELARARDAARSAKDFAEADRLREAIENAGFLVEDTPRGTKLRPV